MFLGSPSITPSQKASKMEGKYTGPEEGEAPLSSGPVYFPSILLLLRRLGQLIDKLLVEPDAVLAINAQTIMGMATWRWRIIFRK
jgi:hypothetical protein